jgi:hypothetical protein
MIINTVISGSFLDSNSVNISLLESEISDQFLLSNSDNKKLKFNYTQTSNLPSSVILFSGDTQEILSFNSINTNSKEILIDDFLTSKGLYTFRIIVTNFNTDYDYIDYKVLYDFVDNVYMTFSESNLEINSYKLISFDNLTNQNATIEIPSHGFIEGIGIKPLVEIGDNIFLSESNIITNVIIRDNIKKIGSNFIFNQAGGTIEIYSDIPPEIIGNPFGLPPKLEIIVPAGKKDIYVNAWPGVPSLYINEM